MLLSCLVGLIGAAYLAVCVYFIVQPARRPRQPPPARAGDPVAEMHAIAAQAWYAHDVARDGLAR